MNEPMILIPVREYISTLELLIDIAADEEALLDDPAEIENLRANVAAAKAEIERVIARSSVTSTERSSTEEGSL